MKEGKVRLIIDQVDDIDGFDRKKKARRPEPRGGVLDNVSEVMSWIERQSDCDHSHLLRLQNKTYVTRKRHQQSRQKK
jgi:hypothetical protein